MRISSRKNAAARAASPSRISPVSTNTQCARLPSACLVKSAATVESSPPLTAQTAFPSPTASRMRRTVSSMKPSSVHHGLQPQSFAKLSRICMPSGSLRSMRERKRYAFFSSSASATGFPSASAITASPSGSSYSAAPQIFRSPSGIPSNSAQREKRTVAMSLRRAASFGAKRASAASAAAPSSSVGSPSESSVSYRSPSASGSVSTMPEASSAASVSISAQAGNTRP